MRVLIVGASGHGRVVADAVESTGLHDFIGFVDASYAAGDRTPRILGSDSDIPRIVDVHKVQGVVIAVGDNWTRAQIVKRVTDAVPALQFPAIIHPAAVVARDTTIDGGSVILAGAVLNPGVSLARHSIVNTGACVDHDSEIGEFASIAPRVACGGTVSVGRFAAIGIGATLTHGVSVGEHAVVGAGAVVIRDIPGFSVAVGVPATVIRRREAGEPYL